MEFILIGIVVLVAAIVGVRLMGKGSSKEKEPSTEGINPDTDSLIEKFELDQDADPIFVKRSLNEIDKPKERIAMAQFISGKLEGLIGDAVNSFINCFIGMTYSQRKEFYSLKKYLWGDLSENQWNIILTGFSSVINPTQRFDLALYMSDKVAGMNASSRLSFLRVITGMSIEQRTKLYELKDKLGGDMMGSQWKNGLSDLIDVESPTGRIDIAIFLAEKTTGLDNDTRRSFIQVITGMTPAERAEFCTYKDTLWGSLSNTNAAGDSILGKLLTIQVPTARVELCRFVHNKVAGMQSVTKNHFINLLGDMPPQEREMFYNLKGQLWEDLPEAQWCSVFMGFRKIKSLSEMLQIAIFLAGKLSGIDGFKREFFIKSFEGMNPSESDEYFEIRNQLWCDLPGEEWKSVLEELIAIPDPSERLGIATLATRLVTPATPAAKRSAIIHILHLNVSPQNRVTVTARALAHISVLPSDHKWSDEIIKLLEIPLGEKIDHAPPTPIGPDGQPQPLDQPDPQAVAKQDNTYLQREAVIGAYFKVSTSPKIHALIYRNLPSVSDTTTIFDMCSKEVFENLKRKLNDGESKGEMNQDIFQLMNAFRGLQLLMTGKDEHGDEIERHPISSLDKYQLMREQGLPNTRQLFVLAYRLLSMDLEKEKTAFVSSWLNEYFNANKEAWTRVHANIKHVVSDENLAQFADLLKEPTIILAMEKDAENGNAFVNAITNGEVFFPEIKHFRKMYTEHRIKALMPMIEGLFFVGRGGNANPKDQAEKSKAACAYTAYALILKAVIDAPLVQKSVQENLKISPVLCEGIERMISANIR